MEETLVTLSLKNIATVTLIGLIGVGVICGAMWLLGLKNNG